IEPSGHDRHVSRHRIHNRLAHSGHAAIRRGFGCDLRSDARRVSDGDGNARKHGGIVTGPWVHGSMGAWVHGSMGPWVHGSMGPWVHGWTYGPMDLWTFDQWPHE